MQSPTRVFTNNIVVRFHPGLEIDGDEVVVHLATLRIPSDSEWLQVITIICSYPEPQVLVPIVPELLQ